MNNKLKYIINLILFAVIAAFAVFIVKSIYTDDITLNEKQTPNTFVSNYTKTGEILIGDTVKAFELYHEQVFALTRKKLTIFSRNGSEVQSFLVKDGIRDMVVDNDRIYFLFPASIEVYSFRGKLLLEWDACSDLSDYCSFTIQGNLIFVTDADGKNICEYNTEGSFIQFIQSPRRFITPSNSFDISSFHDTVYCVNPGRHLIETYTLKGDFIAAFGGPGTEKGFFSGCSNPAYICIDEQGTVFTSEKGIPRISCYDRKGNFKEMILNHRLLGAGNKAHEIETSNNKLWVSNQLKIDIYEHK